MSYTVVRGDTLSTIAARLHTSVSALASANGIRNINMIRIGQVLQTPGSGGGGGAPAPAPAPAPAGPPASPLTNAVNAYGELAQTLMAVPVLNTWLQSQINAQMSPSAMLANLKATPWWQQNSSTARTAIMTAAADPAEWQQQLNNQTATVFNLAQQLGVAVDARQIAQQSIMEGWSQAQLQSYLGSTGTLIRGMDNAFVGNAAQTTTKLQQLAQNYDVPITDQFLQDATHQILSGRDTIDGFTQVLLNQAKAKYPQFAPQLDAGQTMRDIADPYMGQMAKTLELSQQSINVDTPEIQKALSTRDSPTGTQTSMPMWKFNQMLMQDPRYNYTTQAKTDAYSTVRQLGKDLGFAS